MPYHEEDEQTAKQSGSFSHPLVVSATLQWAPAAAPGVQNLPDTPAVANRTDQLDVSLSRAVEAIPTEPLAQRFSRQLLEKRAATQ